MAGISSASAPITIGQTTTRHRRQSLVRTCIGAGAIAATMLLQTVAGADDRPLVWCFGDSVAGQLCSGLIARGYGDEWNIVDHSINGATTHWGVSRLERLLPAETPPDVVVLEFGGNDLLFDEQATGSPTNVFDRMMTLRSMFEQAGTVVVLTTTPVRMTAPGRGTWVDRYLDRQFDLNYMLRRIRGCRTVDIRTHQKHFADFLHPKMSWVEKRLAHRVGRRVARELRRLGF